MIDLTQLTINPLPADIAAILEENVQLKNVNSTYKFIGFLLAGLGVLGVVNTIIKSRKLQTEASTI